MTKTLYAISLYLLVTCLTPVYGLTSIETRTTSNTMQNSFFVNQCMFLRRIQPGFPVTLNDCENSPLWDISPSETDFNPIKLTGTGFCLEANIDREEVFINPCSGGDEQRFLFNNVGQVILELNRGSCVGAKTDGINLEVALCGDQFAIWIGS